MLEWLGTAGNHLRQNPFHRLPLYLLSVVAAVTVRANVQAYDSGWLP